MKLELDELITRCEEISKDLNKRACTLYESQDYEKSKDCIWRAADYKQLAEQIAEWREDLKKYREGMVSERYKPIILQEHDAEPRTMRAILDVETNDIYILETTKGFAEGMGMTIEDVAEGSDSE